MTEGQIRKGWMAKNTDGKTYNVEYFDLDTLVASIQNRVPTTIAPEG